MKRPWLLAILCCFAVARGLDAQTNYVVLSGVVMDPQHLAIPHANIKLTSTTTGAERKVTANVHGEYEVGALLPGAYLLEAESKGFAVAQRLLQLEVGQQVTLDVMFKVGTDTQTVTAVTAAELLKTADASVSGVVDQTSVTQLPLNGRMLVDLMLTVPGAHVSHGAQTGDMNPSTGDRDSGRQSVLAATGRMRITFCSTAQRIRTLPSILKTSAHRLMQSRSSRCRSEVIQQIWVARAADR